jgi:hypothetical protein
MDLRDTTRSDEPSAELHAISTYYLPRKIFGRCYEPGGDPLLNSA